MTIQFYQNETLSESYEQFLAEAHVLIRANIIATEDVGIAMTAAVKPYQELYNTMSHVLYGDTVPIQIINALHRLSATNSAPNVAQKIFFAPLQPFQDIGRNDWVISRWNIVVPHMSQ